jgi:DNA gyrase, B subunit
MADTHQTYDENQIQVLEGLEAVRKRPGMYIGSTSARGLHHLVYEIVDNSIDEALAGECTEIKIVLYADGSVLVADNGRGIPTAIHHKAGIPTPEVVFTVLHAGGKFGGSGYNISGGLHGVGASVVNALSEWLEYEDCYEGFCYTGRFERGAVASPYKCVGQTERHGLTVRFKPDREIFEETVFDYTTLLNRMREQAFLNAGIKIILRDERKLTESTRSAESVSDQEEEADSRTINSRADEDRESAEQILAAINTSGGTGIIENTLCYEGGIISFVEHLNHIKHCEVVHPEVIYMKTARDSSIVEVAMQYNDTYNETLMTFANNISTPEGGTHEQGFKLALTRVVNEYAKKLGYIKDEEKKLSGEDAREGLCAVVSVKLRDAQFEGQTKAKLGNSEMRTLVNNLVGEKLGEYFEENPTVVRAVLDKALAAAKAREAARKAREQSRKSVLEGTSLPGKLWDCQERRVDVTEVFLVEGNSAGGSAKEGRNSKFQAILPLRGKVLNVEKSRLDKIYANTQLIPIIKALGCGIGEDFDINKLRYGKIVIMADADVDGSHIRILLLTFFFRHMKKLIEDGHIFLAQPPLYKVFKGKQERYAFTESERDKYITELGGNNPENVMTNRYKGLGEMNPEQLWETTMDPERRTLLRVSIEDALACDEIFSVLMGDRVEPRRVFIEENAQYATELDI